MRIGVVLGRVRQVLAGGVPTVGAAFAVYRDDGALLMVRSRHAPGWGLPAGVGRRGEPIHETALRELWEETGVTPAPGYELIARVPKARSAHVTTLFTGRLHTQDGGRPPWRRRLEIREAAWFVPDEIAGLKLRNGTDAMLGHLRQK